MKTYFKKSLICLAISLLFISCFCYTSVDAASRAYYKDSPFQFSGTAKAIMSNYDGNYMAIEAKATSASGTSYEVTLKLFLYNRQVTETFTLYSNGSTYKFDYIYLGSAASSDTSLVCKCSAPETITMELTSYSWYS